MATDNDNDPNKSRLNNEELLNPKKDTQEERIARGPQRVPGQGQRFQDAIKGQNRGNIQKPGLYYESMKAKDQQQDTSKQPDKQPDNDKDKN